MAGGTHQMLFVVAAMTLLSQITLVVNQFVGSTIESNLQSEATITATGLAQSMLREVSMKAFDENTVAATVTDPASLTAPNSLGPEHGEPSPPPFPTKFFDDIDDFEGYVRIVTTARLGNYRVRTQVSYVEDDDLDGVASMRTFYKKVTVTVDQNTSIAYPVTMSKLISY